MDGARGGPALGRWTDARGDLPAAADNIVIVIPAVGASAASEIGEEPAAYGPTPPAAKMVGASPDTKLREGKAAREGSAAAEMAVADSSPSEMDG